MTEHITSNATLVNVCTGKPSVQEICIYGTLAVVLISLPSLTAVLALPALQKRGYKYVMIFLMSLSVGMLTTDALLHLIPGALGLHTEGPVVACSRKDNATVHEDQHENDRDSMAFWKMALTAGSIYLLHVFESIAHFFAERMKKRYVNPLELYTTGADHNVNINEKCNHAPFTEHSETVRKIFGLKPIVIMISLSDALHNFVDGLAIGSAFSVNKASGLSTAIATLCHEIPSEIGDFAVLIASGLSVKSALLLNLVTALTEIVGLYVGIAIASVESLQAWMLAIVAGMFLYVSLVAMLHEIRLIETNNAGLHQLCATLGMFCGITALLIFSLLEPFMQVAM